MNRRQFLSLAALTPLASAQEAPPAAAIPRLPARMLSRMTPVPEDSRPPAMKAEHDRMMQLDSTPPPSSKTPPALQL